MYNDPAYDLFTLNPDNYEIVNSLGTFDRDKLLRYHLVPGDKYIFNIRSGGSGELIDISTKSYAFSISEIVRSYVSNDTASMIIHTFDFHRMESCWDSTTVPMYLLLISLLLLLVYPTHWNTQLGD